MTNTRRFPPPWSVEETEACFIVRDHAGLKLAHVYFENEPGRQAAASLLTGDEARRIAANIAKLPDLLRKLFQSGRSAPKKRDVVRFAREGHISVEVYILGP